VAQQGIFKPAVLHEVPLSIRTTPEDPSKPRPYDDGIGLDGLLRYRFRGTDPSHPHNVGLRLAMRRQTPLVYLFGIIEGQYLPAYPVYVVGEDAADLAFRVSVDDRQLAAMSPAADTLAEVRRSTRSSSTLRTFCRTATLAESRSFPTGSRSAGCTMGRSMRTSSECDPTW
jgi:putative restriction endonuclease